MGRPRKRDRKRSRARAGLGDDDDYAAAGEEEEPVLFPVGAQVEVRSDEEGFVGSFYEATVEGYLPSGRGYVVAYATLVTAREEGDGRTSSPLREGVAAADVRPRPPTSATGHQQRREFAVHEIVEAFHNEGWWAGVVCRVPTPAAAADNDDDGKSRPQRRVYSVCFPATREVLEFDEARLRPRLVFQGDRWVTAAEAENRSPMFTVGSQVEVSRSQKTFGEYWSPATVLKVIDATSFVVHYENVREDGDLITEIMDAQYIRPARNIIHMDSKYRFPPSSFVEVFHEGSWWPGVILEVVDDNLMKKYIVKIKSHETQMNDVEGHDVLTVEHTKLRPRYDWCDRKWVRCLTEKQFNRGSQSKSAKRPISFTVKSSNDIDNIAALTSSKDSEIRFDSGPSTMEKTNNADATFAAVCPDLSMCGDIVQIKQKPCSYPEETLKQPNSVPELASTLALPSRQSVSGFCHLKYDPKLFPCNQLHLSCLPMISVSPVPKSGELQASLFGAFGQLRPLPQGPVLGIQSFNTDFSSIRGTKDSFSFKEKQKQLSDKGYCLMTEAESQKKPNPRLSVGTSLYRKRINESISSLTPEELGENPDIVLTKKGVVDKNAEFCKVARNDHQQHEDNRDDMVQLNTSCLVPIDNLSNMSVAMSSDIMPNLFPLSENCEANKEIVMGVADCHGNKMELPIIMLETHHASTDGPSAASLPALKSDIGIIAKGFKKSAADEHVPPLDCSCPMVDFTAECSPSTDESALTQLPSVIGSKSTEFDHGNRLIESKDAEGTPMSKYVPSRAQDSCHLILQRSLDVHKSIIADRHPESLVAENLPCAKTSPMWAQFEAMEMFSKVPQRPNFHQFQHYVPELREGMALGLMLSFTNLGESIMQLNIEDDSSLFEEKMKGLSSLEAHGFDVRHLRSHLETLLRMKNGRVDLQDAIKKLEEKINHEEAVDRQLGAKIDVLNSTICQLDLHAYLLRRITQSDISQKVNCAVEISRLKAELSELRQLYLSAEECHADAVAAPW